MQMSKNVNNDVIMTLPFEREKVNFSLLYITLPKPGVSDKSSSMTASSSSS